MIADHDDVVSVRAEDASGSFGILPGHADLITVLTPSVVAWRHVGRPAWLVRGAWRRAVGARRHTGWRSPHARHSLATILPRWNSAVLARFRAELDAERRARVAATKLHTAAIRQIIRALRPDGHQAT